MNPIALAGLAVAVAAGIALPAREIGQVTDPVDAEATLPSEIGAWTKQPTAGTRTLGVYGSRTPANASIADYLRDDGAAATTVAVAYAEHLPTGAPFTRLVGGAPAIARDGIVLEIRSREPSVVVWRLEAFELQVSGDSGIDDAVHLAGALAAAARDVVGPQPFTAPVAGGLGALAALGATVGAAWPRRRDARPRWEQAAFGGASTGLLGWSSGAFVLPLGTRSAFVAPISPDPAWCAVLGAGVGVVAATVVHAGAQRWRRRGHAVPTAG